MKTDIEKALAKIEFENREDNRFHTPYDKEIEFYQTIKMGNVEEAMQLLRPFNSDGMGVLSEDKLRNLKYHLIISIAFITNEVKHLILWHNWFQLAHVLFSIF